MIKLKLMDHYYKKEQQNLNTFYGPRKAEVIIHN